MKHYTLTSLLFFGLFSAAQAVTVVTTDFEGTNDTFGFGFSQGAALTWNVDNDSGVGPGGSEALEVVTTNSATGLAFAGGGMGFYDLSTNPMFTSGAITVADLDTISFTLDVAGLGDGISDVRLEAAGIGGSYPFRLNLPINPLVGSFTNYNISLASLSLTERTALANYMNNGSAANPGTSTVLNMAFSINNNGTPQAFDTGTGAIFDNFVLTVAMPVPEPSRGLLLLVSLGLIGLRRVRR